jgi:hypothetical protein
VSCVEACHACGARTRTAFFMWVRERPPLVLSINVDPAYLDELDRKLRASGYELKEPA